MGQYSTGANSRHLPRLRIGLARIAAGPPESRATQGYVGHRTVPQRRTGRTRLAGGASLGQGATRSGTRSRAKCAADLCLPTLRCGNGRHRVLGALPADPRTAPFAESPMTASKSMIFYYASACVLRRPREEFLHPAANTINSRDSHWQQRTFPNRCRAYSAAYQPVYGVAVSQHRASRQYPVSLFPIAPRPL